MSKIATALLTVLSFILFVYSVFKSAACFYDCMYIPWLLFLSGSILAYNSYRHFINSFNEEDKN